MIIDPNDTETTLLLRARLRRRFNLNIAVLVLSLVLLSLLAHTSTGKEYLQTVSQFLISHQLPQMFVFGGMFLITGLPLLASSVWYYKENLRCPQCGNRYYMKDLAGFVRTGELDCTYCTSVSKKSFVFRKFQRFNTIIFSVIGVFAFAGFLFEIGKMLRFSLALLVSLFVILAPIGMLLNWFYEVRCTKWNLLYLCFSIIASLAILYYGGLISWSMWHPL